MKAQGLIHLVTLINLWLHSSTVGNSFNVILEFNILTVYVFMKNLPVCSLAINIMVDPDGTLDALASLALASPTTPKPKTSNGASKPPNTISPNRELPGTGLSRPQASGEGSAITKK